MNLGANLSDADLDQAYAAAWDTKQYPIAEQYGSEIISRLASPWSFVSGILGNERFPKYTQRVRNVGQSFGQVSATRESVADSAANVADAATGALKIGGVALAAVAVIAVVVYAASR